MSRELLKRALDELLGQENGASINDLVQDIETYLAQPEPEPVEKCHPDYHRVSLGCKSDQSAQISELIAQRTLQESIIKSAYTACRELEERLAALQAKRETLSDGELDSLRQNDTGKLNFVTLREFRVIARAIEAAHGIGINHE